MKKQMMKQEVICLLAEDHYGVLARIASLFGRKGYSIDTLTVSTTTETDLSRITLTVSGEQSEIKQIMAQCAKIEEVRSVVLLSVDNSVLREILLMKLALDADKDSQLSQIMEICNIYKATVVSLTADIMILELTGKPVKIDAFVDLMQQFDVMELSRSGATAMARQKVLGKDE